MNNFRIINICIGIIGFILVYTFADFGVGNEDAILTAAIAFWIAYWWITEPVPLAATSLLPIILFPVFGLVAGDKIAKSYFNSTILLFLGGFIIALAMEKWNLHKRIALVLISFFGKSTSSIVLGFMIASAFLSMWISNTATAVMILPIGLAMLYKIEDQTGLEASRKFSISLMLGIAYGCSVGGISTIIGTPPNLVFQRIYSIQFPDNPAITFGEWIIFAIPLSITMLLVIWLILTKLYFRLDDKINIDKSVIVAERKQLGGMSYQEKIVSVVFISTAVLWIFRNNIDTGFFTITGWSSLLPSKDFIDDGTIAIAMSILLFIIPARDKTNDSIAILDNRIIRKIPWEIILLFGGGFALAEGFISTGLSEIIGAQFSALHDFPVYLTILIICLSITFLTELTSNTATAQIILPILASLSVQLEIDPKIVMIPATISASMAFMMPVATPPNAIIFGSGRLKVFDMVRSGFAINLIGAFIISIYCYISFS